MRVSTIAAFATLIASAFSIPTPQGSPYDPDICLQRSFLSASLCSDINPAYTNDTLSDFGWYCCWYQVPAAPPPAMPVSAWLTFAEDGSVANRCLGSGACITGLPGTS
ncbi:hypothetical protein F4781DRAFT_401356 [Annulohypoxylon bovei var. microspora]|nr:hypothetical protein F4781DRAFT_401356 [Annulohypoxylon bovei var. microspora]